MKPLLALLFATVLAAAFVVASRLGGSEATVGVGVTEPTPTQPAPAAPTIEPPSEEPQQPAWDFRAIVEPTLPPDPPEQGSCALFLELVDSVTREYVASEVDLYRLGVAGNEVWTEGDQLQATLDVPEGGISVESLPEGDYRIRCVKEASHADDPPPFTVQGEFTRVTLEVVMPRELPVHLRVVDATGETVTEARAAFGKVGHVEHGPKSIRWLERRQLVHSDEPLICHDRETSFDVELVTTPASADPDGFLLGEVRQGTHRGVDLYRGFVDVPEGSRVRVELDGEVLDEVRLLGVTVDPSTVAASLRLPDGSADPTLVERLSIESGAVRVREATPADAWREIPIAVTVEAGETHAALKFTFRPSELPLAVRTLGGR